MSRSRWLAAATLATVIGAGGAWLLMRGSVGSSTPVVTDESSPQTDEVAREFARLRARPADDRFNAPIDPADADWRMPLADVAGRLQAQADAGDVRAMYVLGKRMSDCSRTLRDRTPEKLWTAYQDELESAKRDAAERPDWDMSNRVRNAETHFTVGMQRYEECTSVERARVAQGVDWLERAGRHGDRAAQQAFAAALAKDLEDRNAVIRDVERLARRRQLAREWIEAGIREGDESSLDLYVESHGYGSGLYARDLRTLVVYEYVRSLVRGRRIGEFDDLWSTGPKHRHPQIPPDQWPSIQSEGQQIFLASFKDAPRSRRRW